MAKPELLAHVKFGRLQRALGLRRFEALGILEALWHHGWACCKAAVGTAEDVAWIVDWPGDAEALVTGLVAAGFLDPDPDDPDEYRVHDWLEHAPHYARLRYGREQQLEAPGDDEPEPPAVKDKLRRTIPYRTNPQIQKSSGDAPPTARVAAAPRHAPTPDPAPMINARVLERLCHELEPGDLSTWGDAADALKGKAAYFRVPYNGPAVTAALERVARGRGAARFVAVVGARGS